MTTDNSISRRSMIGVLAGGLVALVSGCESQETVNKREEEHKVSRKKYQEQNEKVMKIKKQQIELQQKSRQERKHQKIDRKIEYNNFDETRDILYPVDRLISNYNGWSIQYTDNVTKEIKEIRFFNSGRMKVRVLADLEKSTMPFVEVNDHYDSSWTGENYDAIIHIRDKDSSIISGGDDAVTRKSGRRHYTEHYKRTLVEIDGEK